MGTNGGKEMPLLNHALNDDGYRLEGSKESVMHFKNKILNLQKENDGLRSNCERLRVFIGDLWADNSLARNAKHIFKEMPEQSLGEIKAQAIEELIESIEWSNYGRSIKNQILDYANNLRC